MGGTELRVETGMGSGDHPPSSDPGKGEPPAEDADGTGSTRRLRWSGDALAVLALVIAAVIARRAALPTDGLAFDDSWVVVGASKAGYGDLLTVSTNHPGFTALLMTWARVVSRRSELFALIPFVAGVATPAVAYLVLRRLRVAAPVGLAAAGLAVVAPAHVIYSGRVKSYVVGGLVTLVLALVVVRLASARWRWWTVLAWVTGAFLLGTLSALTLVVTAVAALVLVLQPAGDRPRRLVALAVQGALQAGYLALIQGSFASAEVAEDWETTYNGYIELDGGPIGVVRQVAAHTGRLGGVLVDVPVALGLALVLIALLGLAVTAWRSDDRAAARLLLALPLIALLGSFLRQVPYGTVVGNTVFPGARANLWLLPSLLVGFGLAVDGATRWLAARRHWLGPCAQGLVVIASLLLVAGTIDETGPYPFSGPRAAHEYIAANARDGDPLVMLPNGRFPYAAEPGVGVAVAEDATTLQGFTIRFTSPHVLDVATRGASPVAALRTLARGADRVFIYNGLPGFGDAATVPVERLLSSSGFVRQDVKRFTTIVVSVWARPGASP